MEPKKDTQQESLFQRIRHSISDFSPQSRIFGVPSPIYKRNTISDFNEHEEIDHLESDSTESADTNSPQEFDSQYSASELAQRSQMLRKSFPLDHRHLSPPDGVSLNSTRSNSTNKLLKPHDQNAPKRPISPMQATIMIQSDF